MFKGRLNKAQVLQISIVTIGGLALLTFLYLGYNQGQKNNKLQQDINQVRVQDKLEYKERMSPKQVEEKKQALEAYLNSYMKAENPTDYKGYGNAEKILSTIFFSSSSSLTSADKRNPDKKREFLSRFSYEISDISGDFEKKDSDQSVLFVKMNISFDGNPLFTGQYYSLILDKENRLVGGTLYGE